MQARKSSGEEGEGVLVCMAAQRASRQVRCTKMRIGGIVGIPRMSGAWRGTHADFSLGREVVRDPALGAGLGMPDARAVDELGSMPVVTLGALTGGFTTGAGA